MLSSGVNVVGQDKDPTTGEHMRLKNTKVCNVM